MKVNLKTKVVSFYSGPGAGKSTLARELAVYFSKNNISHELVTEWVKAWAWEGKVPQGAEDNLYILAKQLKAEKTCYGKVEYIITDSPLGLPAIYEEMYNNETTCVRGAVAELLRVQALKSNIERINLLVERRHAYVSEGRFQTLEKAQKIDGICKSFLGGNYLPVRDLESSLAAIETFSMKVVDSREGVS